jgi:hypothetical protein
MGFKIETPVRNAFNMAARVGGISAIGFLGLAAFTGTFELGAVVVAAASAFAVSHSYEKKLEAAKQADAESRRPSEGPGW